MKSKCLTNFLLIGLFVLSMGCQPGQVTEQEKQSISLVSTTFCNPMDLNYRFMLDEPSRREAADPTITFFKDRYYLFASKSGGYWHSQDLADWDFIETDQIPTEEYAPTAIGIGDVLYFLASSNEKSTIYQSADPLSGVWSVAKEELEMPVWDPAFFLDDDDKLYLYWGCSNENPLYGVEVDYLENKFEFMSDPVILKYSNPDQLGWEVPGDYNTEYRAPWIEGAWVNKYNGKYYYQYAGPGTEFKSYADAVYVSDQPLGPFELQAHNPFAYKPEGFAAGAGHGSTIADQFGNYWHIGTITISQKHMFERRLGLYPTFFDQDGTMYAITKYSDFPMKMPTKKITANDVAPEWMLLSYNKTLEVSSEIDSLPATNVADEDIRTYWAAQSGDPGEYVMIDLEEAYDVYAIQVNFAEHQTNLFGINKAQFHAYTLEYSSNEKDWTVLREFSNTIDKSHNYLELDEMVNLRYLRVTNKAVPGGHFAISGLRVFGLGNGSAPKAVKYLAANRDNEDRRKVDLVWDGAEGADGYTVSYGVSPDKLYQGYQVFDQTELTINSLNAELDYYYTIEAFNENGITPGGVVVNDAGE